MGVVYEGVQEGLGRRVAIKCLHPHLATSADFIARFMIEARLASRLAHPNVVRVYDFGTEQTNEGPLVYLVMEFCSGVQLGALVTQRARFPLSRIASIMGQVLAALAEAHDHGIVHRDVKPENVILQAKARGGEVTKLIDFGIAETRVEGRRAARAIAGTPDYLSPEVIRGEEVDHQADLYAAGAMLFELVTGRVLFEAETPTGILEQQLHAPRPDPRVVAPEREIPDELAAVCLRAVALDPRARFEDADAFADALASAISAPPSRPPGDTTPPRQPAEPAAHEPALPSDLSHGSIPRPPLQSGPGIRSITPTGRYSHRPGDDDRVSGERSARSHGSNFWVIQDLEREATTAMASRRWEQAVEKLRAGLQMAAQLVDSGEVELGAAAFTSFGRRAGEALRRDGRFQEAIDALGKALLHAPIGELSRALLLEELGLNAMALGRTGDALGAWLDASEVARTCGNAAVERRLMRRLENG